MAIMAQKRALRNYRTRLVKRGMAFAEDDDSCGAFVDSMG
jgi:hypothetical protein